MRPRTFFGLGRLGSAFFAALLVVATSSGAAAFAPLPELPAQATPGAANVSGFTAEQVRRGIVQIEQSGRTVALGVVLLKDGRIITALSGLPAAALLDVRYANGSVVKAKVAHRDEAWDLALLIPQVGKWEEGLVPTDADPQGVELRTFLTKGGKLSSAPIAVKGRIDAASKGGEVLRSALDLDFKGGAGSVGAPLLDANGRVVGLIVHACKEAGASEAAHEAPPSACKPLTIGAPVYALRRFLVKTPADAVLPTPWLGLGGAPSTDGPIKGVKVMGVAPGSPAEKAALKPGVDIIVAVEDQPVETPDHIAELIAKRAVGQQVKLLVFSGGKFRDTQVTLRAAP